MTFVILIYFKDLPSNISLFAPEILSRSKSLYSYLSSIVSCVPSLVILSIKNDL